MPQLTRKKAKVYQKAYNKKNKEELKQAQKDSYQADPGKMQTLTRSVRLNASLMKQTRRRSVRLNASLTKQTLGRCVRLNASLKRKIPVGNKT